MFIKLNDKKIVNTNAIASLEYTPAKSGVDDEVDPPAPYTTPSILEITLLSVEYKVESAPYDGEFQGIGTQSQTIRTRGVDADRVWEKLCAMCDK